MTDLFTPRPDPVAVNEHGQRIGEGHQRAILTDREVDAIRDAYEAGEGGYRRLARMFEVSPSNIRKIVKCQTRAQLAMSHRRKR